MMKRLLGLILAMGFVSEASAGITLYGDGDGYDSNNKDWQSNTTDDIDGNGLGTDGYIFFGDFDGIGGNQTYGGVGSSITAIAADKVTDVLPSYITSATIGANAGTKIGSFPGYEALDNPLIGDGTDGVCGNLTATGAGAVLNFTVSGLTTGAVVRVGVVTVLNDDHRARWDQPTIQLSDGGSTVSVTGLPNLSSNANTDGPGWVFFDIDSNGDYTVLIPPDAAGIDPDTTGIGGVTFDSFTPSTGATLLLKPGAFTLDVLAPETSNSAILKASYHAGTVTSNDIEIVSLVAGSGFSASVADNTLGLSDTEEDILVTFNNNVGGLADGHSANSTLAVTWTELGSGSNNVTNIALDATYSDPLGSVDIDVVEQAWYFFDYDDDSTFSSSDPSGYTVGVANGSQDQIFPAEIQQFPTGFDLSEIGQKITAEFDVQLNTLTSGPHANDFRFGFFDTSENVQIIARVDLGTDAGRTNFKLGNEISYNNGSGGVYVNGDYATLCILYGNSLGSTSGSITTGLAVGEPNHFKYSIERTGVNELTFINVWSDSSSTKTATYVLDETTAVSGIAEYIPTGGYESFDGFGLQIHEQNPGVDYTLSNFTMTYSIPVLSSYKLGVSEFVLETSGDVTLTLAGAIVGASYQVKATDDLVGTPWQVVGTYVAAAPGVIVVPQADVAPYIGDDGFFVVVLPLNFEE